MPVPPPLLPDTNAQGQFHGCSRGGTRPQSQLSPHSCADNRRPAATPADRNPCEPVRIEPFPNVLRTAIFGFALARDEIACRSRPAKRMHAAPNARSAAKFPQAGATVAFQ